MKLRILAQADCRAALDMAGAIEAQAQAFRLLAQGRSVQGLRSFVASEAPPGVAIFNPCFPARRSRLRHQGHLRFLRQRQARACAHERARLPLRRDERPSAGGAGSGLPHRSAHRGRDCARGAVPRAREQQGSRVDWRGARGAQPACRACRGLRARNGAPLDAQQRARGAVHIGHGGRGWPDAARRPPCSSCEQAVREADIIVAATTSATPVIAGAWLRPGAFVAAVGAHQPTTREVDSRHRRSARRMRVIDSRADCLDQAGDFVIPIAEGVIAAGANIRARRGHHRREAGARARRRDHRLQVDRRADPGSRDGASDRATRGAIGARHRGRHRRGLELFCDEAKSCTPSWPGLARPSTSCLVLVRGRSTWLPANA